MLDTLGVAVAGSGDPWARAPAPLLPGWGAGDEATLWGHGTRLPAGGAALGKERARVLAARRGCPRAADVTAVGTDGGITVSRPVYAGKATYTLRVTAPRCVISLRPNSVTPVEQPRTVTLKHAVLAREDGGAVAAGVGVAGGAGGGPARGLPDAPAPAPSEHPRRDRVLPRQSALAREPPDA